MLSKYNDAKMFLNYQWKPIFFKIENHHFFILNNYTEAVCKVNLTGGSNVFSTILFCENPLYLVKFCILKVRTIYLEFSKLMLMCFHDNRAL